MLYPVCSGFRCIGLCWPFVGMVPEGRFLLRRRLLDLDVCETPTAELIILLFWGLYWLVTHGKVGSRA